MVNSNATECLCPSIVKQITRKTKSIESTYLNWCWQFRWFHLDPTKPSFCRIALPRLQASSVTWGNCKQTNGNFHLESFKSQHFIENIGQAIKLSESIFSPIKLKIPINKRVAKYSNFTMWEITFFSIDFRTQFNHKPIILREIPSLGINCINLSQKYRDIIWINGTN